MEVSRQTVWILSGLLARMLMMAVLLTSVRLILDNRLIHEDDLGHRDEHGNYKLQSHTYLLSQSDI